tara:strand:+ start:1440 stop:2060 length:621 start_codon:yes stop_codon:yes gene_type:complete
MKVLELFAGSRSVGKACEELDYEVYSSDINAFPGIDYVADIRDFDIDKVPFVPDIIWASPPCTYFSVASIGKHWNKDNTPKSDNAMFGVEIVSATLYIINVFKSINPNLIWYMENPRGKLRKLSVVDGLHRNTVTYCQYGDTRMKPTDIWTNNLDWKPRPMCKNGMPCHVSAPRGSQTGTQGMKGNYERSKIPHELCVEILKQTTF